jgi:glycosyltransferase involved in cell wall biosynthesis
VPPHLPTTADAKSDEANLPRVLYMSDSAESGYAVAGRRLMLALEKIGCPLRWQAMQWYPHDPLLPDETAPYVPLQRLRTVDIEPDVVIAHATPDFVPALLQLKTPAAPLVLHTVWEHEVLPPHWPMLINQCDGVIVPTRWNAAAFRHCGVTIPIIVVPHIHNDDNDLADTEFIDALRHPGQLLVHSIGEWTRRKTPYLSVEAYARAFGPADETLMILRTSEFVDAALPAAEGPNSRRHQTSWVVAQTLHRNAPAPRLHLVTHRISFAEVAGMHASSDVWISLPRSEGWDLGCFDAAVAGCPVITTGFGGPLEYLDPKLCHLIPGKTVECDWLPGATWCQPDVDAAVEALRAVRNDPAAARKAARDQADRLRATYAPEVVARAFVTGLHSARLIR